MTVTRAVSAIAKLRRMPALVVFRKVAHVMPFMPIDVTKLCFLRLDAVPHVPPALLRGRGAVRRGTSADLDDLAALQDKRAIFESRFAAGNQGRRLNRSAAARQKATLTIEQKYYCRQPINSYSGRRIPNHAADGQIVARAIVS